MCGHLPWEEQYCSHLAPPSHRCPYIPELPEQCTLKSTASFPHITSSSLCICNLVCSSTHCSLLNQRWLPNGRRRRSPLNSLCDFAVTQFLWTLCHSVLDFGADVLHPSLLPVTFLHTLLFRSSSCEKDYSRMTPWVSSLCLRQPIQLYTFSYSLYADTF